MRIRRPTTTLHLLLLVFLAALGAAVLSAHPLFGATRAGGREKAFVFRDVRSQAEEFIDYYHSIRLTAAQQKIKEQALGSIPAPCCRDYSILTCCCPCNSAKAVWGLSHYLIVKRGYGAPEVKKTVLQWLEFINPNGYTGDACFTGGCQRPFSRNGCGGMDETRVIAGSGQ